MKNSEIKRLISDGWVQVLFTMTVQGNDGKKVDEALRSQLNEMEKLGKIVESKISKPELIEKSKSWYSQFSEIEIMLDNPDKIFDILLDYMVNSVEIIAPDNLKINSQTYQDRLNDLAIKFRETEKAVLYLSARNKILERENKK